MATLRLIVDPSGAKRGYREAEQAGDRFKRSAKGVETQTGRVQGSFNRLRESAVSLRVGLIAASAATGGMIKAASDIEKGMIGVQKTTGLADSEIQKLRDSLLGFATQNNVTIDSLLETAKVAGQMGIQGQEAISKFTQAFAKLEVASDRTVAGEAGAQAFSKFLDLSGEGIEAADSVASALVELGNTSKTTEGQILNMSTEIVRNTARFNIGGANILGLATALEESGVKAEVAGSSMQRFFEGLNTSVISGGRGLDEFIELTGRSREELQQLIATNPSQVLVDFAAGLNQANAEGANTASMLDEMGLGGIRAASTMNVLAERHEQLRDKLQASNAAQRENVALQAEADAANRGTAAAIQKMTNSLQKLATSRFFEQVVNGFTGVIEILTTFANFLGNTAMPAITLFVSDGITLFMDLRQDVVEIVGDMVEGIERAIIQPLRNIGDSIKGWTEGVTGFFGDMYESVVGGSFVPDMMEGIRTEFDSLPDIMVDPASDSTGRVTDSFRTMRDSISTLLSDVITGTKSFGDSMKSILGNIANNILQAGIDRISGAITEGIAAKFSGSGGFLASAGKSLFSGGGGAGKAISAGASKLFGGGAIEAGTGASASAFPGLATLGPQIGVLAAPFIARELFGGGNVDKLIGQAGQSLQGAQMQPGGSGTQIGAQGGFGVASGPNIGFVAATDAAKNMSTAIVELDENTRAFKDVTMREMMEITAQAEVKFEQLKTRGASMFADLGVSGRQMGDILRDGLVNESEKAALGLQHIGAVIENPKTGMKELGDLSVSQFDRITEAVQKGEIRLSALQGETELSQREMKVLGEIGVGAHSKIVSSARNAAGAEKSFGNTASSVMSSVSNNSATAAKSFGRSFTDASNQASSALKSFGGSGESALSQISAAARSATGELNRIPRSVDVSIHERVRRTQVGGGGGGNIPGAQHGGVLSGPKSGFLAELHGTEAVIPLKNGSVPVEIQGGGGGQSMVVNINQTINGGNPEDIARATRREFQRVANGFPIR